ncbi:MAG TPA: bifunctional 4-hydroxy-2-oxoglutarate aldolase/2-dehydro-3-deoxy-phosphogluconate aldolase [Devosiaceae bacterium]
MPQDAERLTAILTMAPVIPVIVLDDVAAARPMAEALVAGGLPVLEVTLRTPNAFAVMAEMARVEGAVVGAGTVRSVEQMHQSVEAGAQFLVSPGASQGILRECEMVPIPMLPGVATPTEAMQASEQGFTFLKFFPAEAMGGIPVLKSFASPLADLTFCPTGGIDVKKAREYLALPNVICVGGSWVTPSDAVTSGDFARIEALAREASGLVELA